MGSTFYYKRVPQRTAVRRPRSRPKTFTSEEAAKKYAEAKGLKGYKLENLGTEKYKKIRIEKI